MDWVKSSHSYSNGDCVETATCMLGVLVRDSEDPRGAMLLFRGSTWGEFLSQVKQQPDSKSALLDAHPVS
jgi:hypothetical protein